MDKSILFRLPITKNEGFLVDHDHLPHFYDRLHYHPELQLKYIVQGSGDLFVGDTFTHFEPDSLFLIGANQSHVFKSDPKYFKGDKSLISESVMVYFQEKSLGNGFFNIQEMLEIRNLIERAGRGVQFSMKVAQEIGPRIVNLLKMSGFPRFLETLSILNDLATTEDYEFLATVNSPEPLTDNENHKVNEVINYIFNHYKDDIKLEDVARVANYSQAAFCHFFKQRTRKTFTQFLNEVRVSKACKLLNNSDLNISQVCYESGFNNVSNFNRQFKKVIGLSPSGYTKKYNHSLEVL